MLLKGSVKVLNTKDIPSASQPFRWPLNTSTHALKIGALSSGIDRPKKKSSSVLEKI
jgi:hypothetical protein